MEEFLDFIGFILIGIIMTIICAFGLAILIYAIAWILIKIGFVSMIGQALNSCGT